MSKTLSRLWLMEAQTYETQCYLYQKSKKLLLLASLFPLPALSQGPMTYPSE